MHPNENDTEFTWTDKATGLHCVAIFYSGHWCGYVGVDKRHPFYGIDYNDTESVTDRYIRVHGGLTYGRPHVYNEKLENLGEDGKFYFGFDCGHSGDLRKGEVPKKWQIHNNYQYRDLDYVVSECEKLANQLYEVETNWWFRAKRRLRFIKRGLGLMASKNGKAEED